MKFYIDEQYITDVSVRIDHPITQVSGESCEDFLIRKLRDSGPPMYSISNKDHDEFTKLREKLCADGYITICHNSWNGDRVLKSFHLNDVKFNKGEKFFCAAAMSHHLQYEKKHGKNTQ